MSGTRDFNHHEVEQKWKDHWERTNLYQTKIDTSKPKYYVLDMFPYPSGAGLHVGHPLGYIASDIFSRYKTQKGFNVLHPMGFDAFGLPAEQYAIKTGVHPAKSTAKNIEQYIRQLSNLGFNYDWSNAVNTSDPEYYKWTQWIFIQLFEHYYDLEQDKAMPIADLKLHLSTSGTAGLHASCGEEMELSQDDWNNMSLAQKDQVLMNYRLAYRKVSYVNWCEELGTVLANDEVINGRSERGNHPVEKKAMKQWSLRITAYAERLLSSLDHLEWSDALKAMQRNWIGKSQGAQVFFDIENDTRKIEIFTTRPDTIFGATFMVLAPEHDYVADLTTDDQSDEIQKYLEYVGSRSERERMSETKVVSGAFTGSYAIHPITGNKIPIWIAEYVLKDYGTGAIMAVPSDDDRDQAFAEKFQIPIISVVDKTDFPDAENHDKLGTMINSDFLNGLSVKDAIERMIKELESLKIGKRKLNYRLRDANYSRQRYWGEPFPICYTPDGETIALDIENLPLELPELDDFKPASGAQSPLSRAKDWIKTSEGYDRETDTMPGFAGSSWYFLRYMDAKNPNEFASQEAINYWQEVDLYIGGTEHAVGHLMYSRFWHKFLFDKGLVPTDEPFKKLVNQGMIQGVIESLSLKQNKTDGRHHFVSAELRNEGEEYLNIPILIDYVSDYGLPSSSLSRAGIESFAAWMPDYDKAIFEDASGHHSIGKPDDMLTMTTISEVGKMSKSKYNVVNPDHVVAKYGADCFRMYEMFLGPIEQSKPWDTNGIDGVSKFLRKLWSLFYTEEKLQISDIEPSAEEYKILHITIDKVDNYIQKLAFNTAVSSFMICVNELKKLNCNKRLILEPLLKLLAPFAPFITEELWEALGHKESIHLSTYPIYDESKTKSSTVEYPVSINGKKRASITVDANASKDDIQSVAMQQEAVQKWIEGKEIRKVIVVPGRMINIVV